LELGLATIGIMRSKTLLSCSKEPEVKITSMGKVTKCMNPDKNCPNVPDPTTAYVVVVKGKPLVLCSGCGPIFQLQKIQEGG
jgi:hypothetical protein